MSKYESIAWTIGLVFVVNVASAFINAGGDLFNMSQAGWQTIVNAGVAAVLAFAISAAAPWIKEYGYTFKKDEDDLDYSDYYICENCGKRTTLDKTEDWSVDEEGCWLCPDCQKSFESIVKEQNDKA